MASEDSHVGTALCIIFSTVLSKQSVALYNIHLNGHPLGFPTRETQNAEPFKPDKEVYVSIANVGTTSFSGIIRNSVLVSVKRTTP